MAWVAENLGDLTLEGAAEVTASPRFRGGQRAADSALAAWDAGGYARRRNEVWPVPRRGASGLSPYIRHGLLPLGRVWRHVAGSPGPDRAKFRDELLWQEYARHLYARVGAATGRALRHEPARADRAWRDPWPREMACVGLCRSELERDGWLVNQTRMWLASQWTVRAGAEWRAGEDRFFAHLLDGSRAANRLGWQWTVGAGTGRPYGFARWQVRKRAPGLCDRCALRENCPIESFPEPRPPARVTEPEQLAADAEAAATAGPVRALLQGEPDAVWLTAESLGEADPALAAHPGLPAVFVWDERRLRGWRLSGKRLVFLAETLAEIGARRPLELHRGDPAALLLGRRLAATFTPVPGWRALADLLGPVAVHPWPWLARPHAGSVRSYSAWRKRAQPTPGSL